jgi:anti-anti-sigma regulatory factor
MKDDPIELSQSDGVAWIKPTGDGCSLNAPRVKAFAVETMRRGCFDFVVDLADCTGVDGHFMGALAGVALRLRESGRGKLHVVRCPPAVEAEIKSIGLDGLYSM